MSSPNAPEIFLGIPDARPDYVQACRDLGAPAMISAAAFARRWTVEDRENGDDHPGFRAPTRDRFAGMRVALDSMGFTAMNLWGGYPVTPDQYFLDLVRHHGWDFWSSQDLCCEPEIAADEESIVARIMETAFRYDELRAWADSTPDAAGQRFKRPMKVIQGWAWHHYVIAADALDVTAEDGVIGIGSVCRRGRSGPAGVLAIIDQLDQRLPKGVRFHLFGVTSLVLEELASHPRVASMDSQAWGMALRREHPTGRTNALAVEYMARFYRAQAGHIARGGKGSPPSGSLPLRPPPIWAGRTEEYRRRAAEVLHAIRGGGLEAWEYGLKMGLFYQDALWEKPVLSDQERWLANLSPLSAYRQICSVQRG